MCEEITYVVDYKNKIIYEIKPNNARAIRDGKKQLEKYRKTISKKYPGKWMYLASKKCVKWQLKMLLAKCISPPYLVIHQ